MPGEMDHPRPVCIPLPRGQRYISWEPGAEVFNGKFPTLYPLP